MDTPIEFLHRLDQDLRAAAARERLAIDEAERRGTSPAAGLGGRDRRGRGRRRPWLMLSAAALALLVLAGSVGFLATGGSVPLLRPASSADAPAAGAPERVQGAGGQSDAFENQPGFLESESERLAVLADKDAAFYSVGAATGGDDRALTSAPAPETASQARASAGSPQQYRDLSKIVRTGRIGIVVENGRFEATADRIRAIAEDNNGSVQESSTRTQIGTFVLRIPERHFDPTITQLGELGTVQFQSQKSQDVTAEFVDNAARLRILKERRAVLEGFLKAADTQAEVLRFFDAVQNVQLDIERLQGQQRFLNDSVAISTITVQLRERDAKAPQNEPVDNPSVGHAFDRAIAGFLNVVGAVVIGLGYLLPVVVAGAIGFVAFRLVRRRRPRTQG